MNNLEKLREQLKKVDERIQALQKKRKELADKIAEQENLKIVGMVRNMELTPEELEKLLKRIKEGM